MASGSPTISLKIEFGGGLELLFSNQRSHQLTIPALVPVNNSTTSSIHPETSSQISVGVPPAEKAGMKPADVTYLIHYLRDHLLKERLELFMENGTV